MNELVQQSKGQDNKRPVNNHPVERLQLPVPSNAVTEHERKESLKTGEAMKTALHWTGGQRWGQCGGDGGNSGDQW